MGVLVIRSKLVRSRLSNSSNCLVANVARQRTLCNVVSPLFVQASMRMWSAHVCLFSVETTDLHTAGGRGLERIALGEASEFTQGSGPSRVSNFSALPTVWLHATFARASPPDTLSPQHVDRYYGNPCIIVSARTQSIRTSTAPFLFRANLMAHALCRFGSIERVT